MEVGSIDHDHGRRSSYEQPRRLGLLGRLNKQLPDNGPRFVLMDPKVDMITRFDFGQFEVYPADPSSERPHPRQQLLSGMEDAHPTPASALPRVQVTPLDDRLQPCGAPFVADAQRRSSASVTVWHARPIHVPYLAVDLPAPEGQCERVILRVANCESFGLDYVIGGDVMGS